MYTQLKIAIIIIAIIIISILMLSLSNYSPSKQSIFITGIIGSLMLGVIAFYTTPAEADDLSRYYYQIDMMRGRGIAYAFEYGTYSVNVISNLIFYIISKTNTNNLLQFMVIIVEGLCITYIIFNESKRKKIKIRTILLYLWIYFGVCALYISISGIRFMLSITIGAVIIYRDLIKNNKDFINVIGYICLPLIHTSSILIPIVRVIVIKHKFVYKYKNIFILSPIFIKMSIPILSKIPVPIIRTIVERIFMYSDYADIGSSFLRTVGYLIFTIVVLYLVKKSKNDSNIEQFKIFINILLLIIVPNILAIKSIYFRFMSLVAILLLPILSEIIDRNKNTYMLINNKILLFISMIIFYIYQFILYSHWSFISM